jgi:hypothetical protein
MRDEEPALADSDRPPLRPDPVPEREGEQSGLIPKPSRLPWRCAGQRRHERLMPLSESGVVDTTFARDSAMAHRVLRSMHVDVPVSTPPPQSCGSVAQAERREPASTMMPVIRAPRRIRLPLSGERMRAWCVIGGLLQEGWLGIRKRHCDNASYVLSVG